MSDPSVAVAIPVHNEARGLRACIQGILDQTISVREIVLVDSGSTDGTLEIAAGFPAVRVIHVDPSDFNHGETRNVGARATSADWVVFTVGDARPADTRWLSRLFDGIVDDSVVAVSGSQIVPHDTDKNPLSWFRPVGRPVIERVQFAAKGAFDALTPAEKMRVTGWDNVTSLYRRDVLLALPFRRTSFAEDLLWAVDALRAGHALAYAPAARVFHYHDENPDFIYRRTLTMMYVRYRALGYLYDRPAALRRYLRILAGLLRSADIDARAKWRWLRYNIHNYRAALRADRDFRRAMMEGDTALDALHERFCRIPPRPGSAVEPVFPKP